jgi:hypothetical protein
MKTCFKCKVSKPADEFHNLSKNKDGLDSKCKVCKREYHRLYYLEKEGRKEQIRAHAAKLRLTNRTNLIEYLKAHPCVDCGEPDTVVLEFDHVRGEKKTEVSNMIKNTNWTNILLEIEKCEVRCANCHKRKTTRQFGHFAYMPV